MEDKDKAEREAEDHRPALTTNQAVASRLDHPAVDKDPSGDGLPGESNRIDFNHPTKSGAELAVKAAAPASEPAEEV